MARLELYEVVEVQDEENNKFFCLFERDTEHVYGFYLFEDEAFDKKKFLEEGGAFSGHTPKFMLEPAPEKRNINEEFSKLLEEKH